MYSILSARKVSDYLETPLTVLILINFCLYTSVGFIKIKFLSGDNLDISYQKRNLSFLNSSHKIVSVYFDQGFRHLNGIAEEFRCRIPRTGCPNSCMGLQVSRINVILWHLTGHFGPLIVCENAEQSSALLGSSDAWSAVILLQSWKILF